MPKNPVLPRYKNVQSDVTGNIGATLKKLSDAKAYEKANPRQPHELWHNYDESNSPKMDVNAGFKMYPKTK